MRTRWASHTPGGHTTLAGWSTMGWYDTAALCATVARTAAAATPQQRCLLAHHATDILGISLTSVLKVFRRFSTPKPP